MVVAESDAEREVWGRSRQDSQWGSGTLGQPSDWDPHGTELVVAAGLHVLGWLLAITVIAAITRSFSRS